MDAALAGIYSISDADIAEHSLDVEVSNGDRINIYENRQLKYVENDLAVALSRVGSSVRLKIAEYAVDKIFIHSGAVAWKGKGIIFPARSFNGKSTLTAALVRLGALYFSDEYAIIDARGRLHPFPKDLSLRRPDGSFTQIDYSVESIGGRAGKRPVPVRLVALTRFETGARWRPKLISEGQAVLGVLNNAVGIRRDPKFVFPVIANLCRSAVAITSRRGDADITARLILKYLDDMSD
jgi:hypothetical protein